MERGSERREEVVRDKGGQEGGISRKWHFCTLEPKLNPRVTSKHSSEPCLSGSVGVPQRHPSACARTIGIRRLPKLLVRRLKLYCDPVYGWRMAAARMMYRQCPFPFIIFYSRVCATPISDIFHFVPRYQRLCSLIDSI